MRADQKPIVVIGEADPRGTGLSADIQIAQSLSTTALPIVTGVLTSTDQRTPSPYSSTPQSISAQLDHISLVQFDYVKLSGLASSDVLTTIFNRGSCPLKFVIDLTLISDIAGAPTLQANLESLAPLAELITLHSEQLSEYCGHQLNNMGEMIFAAKAICKLGAKAILVKPPANNQKHEDFIYVNLKHHYTLLNPNPITLSDTSQLATAITCFLNKGTTIDDALILAFGAINQANELAKSFGEKSLPTYCGTAKHIRHIPKRYAQPDFPALSFASCDTQTLGIYPVVDSAEWIEKLLPLGITTIQLRIKQGTPEFIEGEVERAVALCIDKNIRLFINDYWQLAIKYSAYGVHLGQEDIDSANLKAIANAGLRLGLSSHCWAEVARALAIKPSYLALGPIYATTSKQMPWIPQGAKAVQQWVSLFDDFMPLVAIGGINLARARTLKETGVGSVAMISAITQADDYRQATLALLELWASE